MESIVAEPRMTVQQRYSVPEITCGDSDSGCGSMKMPVLGMGTASYPFAGTSGVKQTLLQATKLGYRPFDTVALYHQTEQSLGEAISEGLQLGLIKSRDELFITFKLWCSDAQSDLVLPALQKTLRNLQLEFLDLYLIHWPISLKPGRYDFPVQSKEELLPMDFESIWAKMVVCTILGLTKSIGVSNFSCKKHENSLATAKIPPAVNQFCKAEGITIVAYSPLGAKGTRWGNDRVVECEVLHQIAKAKGKFHAQICLRWVYEQGVSLVAKSFNENRMKENLEIFDWELNAEDLKKISEIPQGRAVPVDSFLSPNGPFKSPEELWDGEI